MTLAEFKIWFDGFCAAAGDVPSKEHWAVIQKTIAEIEPDRPAVVPPPTPEPISRVAYFPADIGPVMPGSSRLRYSPIDYVKLVSS